MSREENRFDRGLLPRDILTPAATLVGLVLTAIGLSTSIVGLSTVLQTLSLALVSVVVLFVSAAFLTCLASLRSSYGIFRVAVVLYTGGWVFAGIFICLLLLGYAWGIQILQIQIPEIPILTVQTLISVAVSISSAVYALLIYRRSRIDSQRLTTLIEQLAEDQNKTKMITKEALGVTSNDPKMAFVKVTIDLEEVLRKMALAYGLPKQEGAKATMMKLLDYLSSKGVIHPATANSIIYVRDIRNRVVHSAGDISERDVMVALDLAATLLAKLSALL